MPRTELKVTSSLTDTEESYLFPLLKDESKKVFEWATTPLVGDKRVPWEHKVFQHQDGIGWHHSEGAVYRDRAGVIGPGGILMPPPALLTEQLVSSIRVRSSSYRVRTFDASASAPAPTGIQDDDVLVAVIAVEETGLTITAPSGWNLIRSVTGTSHSVHTYYKVASSEASSVYEWTWGGSNEWFEIAIVDFVGVDTSDPINTDTGGTDTVDSTGIESVGITGSEGNIGLLVYSRAPGDEDMPLRNFSTWGRVVLGPQSGGDGDGGNTLAVVTNATLDDGICRTVLYDGASEGTQFIESRVTLNNSTALPSALPTPIQSNAHAVFDNEFWYAARSGSISYILSIDYYGHITYHKSLTGQVTAMEVFENELVVALGDDDELWIKASGVDGAWTESSDVFAVGLALDQNKLWRSKDNVVNNCITNPETLSNYAPANPNEYEVGDSTYDIEWLVEYAGFIWAAKRDGVYAPNDIAEFYNQTPQLQNSPGEISKLFKAKGYLWAVYSEGLLRLSLGESKWFGPETGNAWMEQYRVVDGFEFYDKIIVLVEARDVDYNLEMSWGYLELLNDNVVFHKVFDFTEDNPTYGNDNEDDFEPKLLGIVNILSGHFEGNLFKSWNLQTPLLIFIWHEEIRLVRVAPGKYLSNHKQLLEQPLIQFSSAYFSPNNRGDLEHVLTEVSISGRFNNMSGERVTSRVSVERNYQWGGFSDTTGNSAAVDLVQIDESAWLEDPTSLVRETSLRFVPAANVHNEEGSDSVTTTEEEIRASSFAIYIEHESSGIPTHTHNGIMDCDYIRDIVARGYTEYPSTDRFKFLILNDDKSRVRGVRQGRSVETTHSLWRHWYETGEMLRIELKEYDESVSVYAKVTNVANANMSIHSEGSLEEQVDALEITLDRIPRAGSTYAPNS